ncbi:MAG: very short patch repair endonuclease [Acetobacteraceae bacterium]
MADPLTPQQRSAHMARIGAKNTRPELFVRRLLHGFGYRYRLYRRDLPGRPDIAFPARRKVIYVHGCFWHQHQSCTISHVPATRSDYWAEKFARTRARDARNISQLSSLGWEALVVWECELAATAVLTHRLTSFLGPPSFAPGAATLAGSYYSH